MPSAALRRALYLIAIIGALYHLYLIVHPYTPLSYQYRIGILDLTQLQRATHVFFLLLIGYLTYQADHHQQPGIGIRWGLSLLLLVLSALPTYLATNYLVDAGAPLAAAFLLTIWFLSLFLPVLSPLSPSFAEVSRSLSVLLALATIAPYVYQVLFYEELIYRIITPEPWDVAMGWTMALLLFGLVLRFIGPEMPLLAVLFILYNIYGYLLPRPWYHPGFDVAFLSAKIYSETEAALFGLITNVSLKYVVYFTLLAGVLTVLGYGDAMAKAFFRLLGKSPYSVGRATVGMGIGMGMISGSGAADTAFIGATMRDIYKAAGYPTLVAAGIVSNAGTLAIITPPILGAVAFIIVEVINVPYAWVIVMSVLPALLYALSILLYNEYYVRGIGIRAVDVPVERGIDLKLLVPFVPALLILIFIFFGYTVRLAVGAAILASVLLALGVPEMRGNIRRLPEGLAEGMKMVAPIGVSITIANVIMSMVVISGLHQKFTIALLNLVGDSLPLAIIFATGFSLLLGLGVPPTATYVLSSLLTAPAIIKLATSSGIPEEAALLATHMFLFYMAMLADVTPPVGLSNFAAAAAFKENPLKIGVKAALVALPKYLYAPSMIWSYWGSAVLIMPVLLTSDLLWTATLVITRVISLAAGTWLIAIANAGYDGKGREIPSWGRVALGVAGVLLILPVELLNVLGLTAGVVLLLSRNRQKS
ncbi:MAG: TRAP transporter large permease subunit [Acidilobaceae archaeon]|nr:TRAP transporter large permease subunit [Acidilobaceae archaeon]MDW7973904.1 TRAP transporter large permease subunit [Sulfolobales archaeon]